MRNIQLILAYDGTDFHGWQTQANQRTVQSELESIIQRVVRHPVNLIASGRTDSGVHAAGQVANFCSDCDLESAKLLHAIGSRLPHDISLNRLRDVPLGFHATRTAQSKLYRYRIYNQPHRPVSRQLQRYVYHYWQPLHCEQMKQAANRLIGTHNFQAFASTGGPPKPSYVRTLLRFDVYPIDQEIRIDVQGTGFLYNQVRNMVGTLIEIGRGHWHPEKVMDILESKDRSQAGPTAPPQGLCLQWVQYPPDHQIHNIPSENLNLLASSTVEMTTPASVAET